MIIFITNPGGHIYNLNIQQDTDKPNKGETGWGGECKKDVKTLVSRIKVIDVRRMALFPIAFNNELPYKNKSKSNARCSNSFGTKIICVLVKSFNLSCVKGGHMNKKCSAFSLPVVQSLFNASRPITFQCQSSNHFS